MTVEELIKICDQKLDEARRNNNENKIFVYEKIKKLFEERPAIFFEADMESCLKILAQLLPEEEIKEAYKSLISPERFEELRRKFKI